MNNKTQNNRVDQDKVNTSGTAEKAFTYNILIPDFAIFVLGISGGFVTLLTVFS